MFKYLPVYAALVVLGTGSVNAQQQDAVLRKVDLTGANYSIIVAMPASSAGPRVSARNQPDPLVVYLADGELVIGVDDKIEKMFTDIGALQHPSCVFHADGLSSNSTKPVAVYITPAGRSLVAQRQEEASRGRGLTMSLTRMEVSEHDFDIVFGIAKSPGSGEPVFKYDNEEDAMFPAIVPMLTPSCIIHDKADVVAVYIVPKAKNLGPPMQ